MRGRFLLALGPVLVVASLAACASPGSLRASSGLRITSPAPLAVVSTPFTVSWDADAGVGSRFAMFVDRPPQGVGSNLSSFVDPMCKAAPPCPDDLYYQRLGIYVVNGHQAKVGALPPLGGMNGQVDHPVRTLTVVAIDGNGRRTSEHSWAVEIRV